MGVHGLWQLIQSTGRPVSLESLEGKILAVDISIWLHHAMKGMRDKDGNPLPNAHLQGLFSRICKLLFYKIKPVFVFDGGVPELKKQTLAARRERKETAEKESEKVSKKLLNILMKKQAVKEVLGKDGSVRDYSGNAKSIKAAKAPDMFELPPVPQDNTIKTESDAEFMWESHLIHQEIIQDDFQNLDEIDIDSTDFLSLPPEVQHEILTEMKETRNKRCLSVAQNAPEESNDFSQYQVGRLLKKSKLTTRIESVRKEMNQRNTGDIAKKFGNISSDCIESRRVMSEDASHYVLIRGINQQRQLEEALKFEEATKMFIPSDTETDDSVSDMLLMTSDSDQINTGKGNSIRCGNIVHSEREKLACSSVSTVCDMVSVDDDSLPHAESHIATPHVAKSQDMDQDTFLGLKEKRNVENVNINGSSIERISDNESEEHRSNDDVITSEEEITKVETVGLSNKDVNISKMEGEALTIGPLSVTSGECPSSLSKRRADGEENTLKKKLKVEDKECIMSDSSESKEPTDSAKDSETGQSVVAVSESDEEIEKRVDLICSKSDKATDNDSVVIVEDASNSSVQDQIKDGKVCGDDESEDEFIEVQSIRSDEIDEIRVSQDIDLVSSTQESNEADQSICSSQKSVEDGGTEIQVDHELPKKEKNLALEFQRIITQDDLERMQDELEIESQSLQTDRRKQDRMAVSITEQMNIEAQELLHLFGLPYVISPMEAEAQCAFLDLNNLTHGSITDDSDIWLFGGSRVYKNFFNQSKHVEFFQNATISTQFGLDREKMICIALLCGSDYTTGIQGVGPVTAMEIMSEFPEKGLNGLVMFRTWWEDFQNDYMKQVPVPKLKAKLRDLDLQPGFPSMTVVDAYMNPTVDDSTEKFSWGNPDLYSLREFAKEKFGWEQSRADSILLPVMKQLRNKDTQRHITGFFQPELVQLKDQVKSKRLKKVLNKMNNVEPDVGETDKEVQPKKVTLRTKKKSQGPTEKHSVEKGVVGGINDARRVNNKEQQPRYKINPRTNITVNMGKGVVGGLNDFRRVNKKVPQPRYKINPRTNITVNLSESSSSDDDDDDDDDIFDKEFSKQLAAIPESSFSPVKEDKGKRPLKGGKGKQKFSKGSGKHNGIR